MSALRLTLSFALLFATCAAAHAQITGDKVKIGFAGRILTSKLADHKL